MGQISLGGSISLVGFGNLEPAELIVVKKLIGSFVKKLSNQADYKSLKLELKQHKKGKTFLHEINANAEVSGNVIITNVNDYNLYSCINKVAEKIMSEILHKKRSAKEVGESLIKEQKKEEIEEELSEI